MSLVRLSSMAISTLLMLAGSQRAAAQSWEAGLSIAVANTNQNAVGFGATLTRWLPQLSSLAFSVRGFADAELAIRDFKSGFGYVEPDREQIGENGGLGSPAYPNEQDLWQMRGWDVHLGAYVTMQLPLASIPSLGLPNFLSLGPGFFYNGLDGHKDVVWVLIAHLSSRAELDVEFLDTNKFVVPSGRWRGRVSLSFWSF